jgi:hypothetical protein
MQVQTCMCHQEVDCTVLIRTREPSSGVEPAAYDMYVGTDHLRSMIMTYQIIGARASITDASAGKGTSLPAPTLSLSQS